MKLVSPEMFTVASAVPANFTGYKKMNGVYRFLLNCISLFVCPDSCVELLFKPTWAAALHTTPQESWEILRVLS